MERHTISLLVLCLFSNVFLFVDSCRQTRIEIDQRIQLEALMSPSDLATWLRAWIHDFSRLIPTIKWARSDLFFMCKRLIVILIVNADSNDRKITGNVLPADIDTLKLMRFAYRIVAQLNLRSLADSEAYSKFDRFTNDEPLIDGIVAAFHIYHQYDSKMTPNCLINDRNTMWDFVTYIMENWVVADQIVIDKFKLIEGSECGGISIRNRPVRNMWPLGIENLMFIEMVTFAVQQQLKGEDLLEKYDEHRKNKLWNLSTVPSYVSHRTVWELVQDVV